jgi:hypothetical protein
LEFDEAARAGNIKNNMLLLCIANIAFKYQDSGKRHGNSF